MTNIEKNILRKEFLKIRDSIPEAKRKSKSRDICQKIFSNLPSNKGKVVALYKAINSEVNIDILIDIFQEEQFEVCLPKIMGDGELEFKKHLIGAKLIKNKKYQILEPDSKYKTLAPDYIILPLVAFDSAKNRLGYGGGYYDKTIETLKMFKPEVILIGAAFSEQQAPLIPTEIHDIKLDMIVTDKRIYI